MSDTGEKAFYLEAAPENLSRFVWASPGSTNRNIEGTETALGTGRKNTSLILAADPAAAAALACKNYSSTVNGIAFTDWFLPSYDELYQLYINRAAAGNSSAEFWSSSQGNNWDAWMQDFSGGEKITGYKNDSGIVRPVRAF